MASVREHYDRHLGPVYGWMVSDFDVAREAARTELRAAGLSEGVGRTAVDLGAGLGAYSIALAEAGTPSRPSIHALNSSRISAHIVETAPSGASTMTCCT